jgi:SulP family sulfate permease
MQETRDRASDADDQTEVNLPGLGALREAVANYAARQLPGRPKVRDDGLAGLNSAVTSVPDGMASGILAGVNPIYGLYACMVGPVAGALVSSTQLMVVVTTSASALAAGQALAGVSGAARDNALFLMVVLVGAFQILFGLLRLGRLIRFVSYSVMTGLIAGIAVLTILSQLPTITRYAPRDGNKVTQALDLLAHLGQIHLPSLALAILALILAITLPRTRVGNFGSLVAIVVPSALAVLFGMDSVQLVRDIGAIPRGVPVPALPSLAGLTPDVVTGALAIAAIVLVQGAGVSQSVPNPDGSRRSTSRDFIGQGAGNVASGFFRGLPVGGSLSTTAVSVVSGARTRWAAIFAGLWMAAIVIIFPGVVSRVAMPALGALLIVASARTIKPAEVRSVWGAGWPARLAAITTFLTTLVLPIQVAVGAGMALSALLHVYASSANVSVLALVERPDGRIEEREPPEHLPSDRVTVLDVYGHLFYAGARTLERLLPVPGDAKHPVVVLRLRGRTNIGATLVDVLSNYADKLQEAGGRLYLTGLSEGVHAQVVRTGKLRLTGPVRAYAATPVVGEATRRALADAQAWLFSPNQQGPADDCPAGEVSR